jgi:galactose mutarotase-like enzyme
MNITLISYQSFSAYHLSTQHWEAVCIPQLGANIAEFTHLATGKQWLWENPHVPLSEHDYGCPYAWGSMAGFDECFPAIGQGKYPLSPYEGVEIPDHGELWAVPWDVEVGDGIVRTWAEGHNFPYRFERVLSSSPGGEALHLFYRLTNLGDAPFTYCWSSHPVFAASPGMKILLPHGTEMLVEESLGDRLGSAGTHLPWPGVVPGLDTVPDCDAGSGQVDKLFATKLTRDWVGLYDPHSHSHLALRFNPAQIDTAGLWISVCGQSGEDRVALEPCIGVSDSLARSIELGSARTLSPRAVEEWWLEMALRVGSLA